MKHYICEDCKIVYGHPQQYCPGCPKLLKMVDCFTSSELESLFEQNWRGEDLEFIYNGQIYYSSTNIERMGFRCRM